jgi:hypothetical protein
VAGPLTTCPQCGSCSLRFVKERIDLSGTTELRPESEDATGAGPARRESHTRFCSCDDCGYSGGVMRVSPGR